MNKKFQIQGPCLSLRHYMADNTAKLASILAMVHNGDYFVMNRPRQYGKTTTLYALTHQIQKEPNYIAIPISFEGIGTVDFERESNFCAVLLTLITEKLFFIDKNLYEQTKNLNLTANNLTSLSSSLTTLLKLANKKVVLLIDEVDQSSSHDVFLNFLGMLRNKYLQSQQGWDVTFYSVILAGVHDIKSLKMKLRSEQDRALNSPWNIAAEFKLDMSFTAAEIIPMLSEYVQEQSVQMDIPAIAQLLFDYTSGYPFLVSKICKVMDETILPQKTTAIWTPEDLASAVHYIINEDNFNFDSLIKNLEYHKDLYNMVFDILVVGHQFNFSIHHPVTQLGLTYGILKNGKGISIHNSIYEQVIYNYMIFQLEMTWRNKDYGTRMQYIKPDKSLDLDKVLLNFQQFMKEQYSEKDQKFVERNGRLVFLSFLKPILNGHGHTFVEPHISDEKRLDIVVTFHHHKYIIELKLWYGPKAHQAGLDQLVAYLDRQHQQKGWLLIFEHRKKKTWAHQPISQKGKDIFAVWV